MREVGLDTRIVEALSRVGITELQQLRDLSDKELRLIPGIGSSSAIAVRRASSEIDADFVKVQAKIKKLSKDIEYYNKKLCGSAQELAELQSEFERLMSAKLA
jgi:DNA repair protein RadC